MEYTDDDFDILSDDLLNDPEEMLRVGGANIYIRMNYGGCSQNEQKEQMNANLEDSGVTSTNPLGNMEVIIMLLSFFLLGMLVMSIASCICCKYRIKIRGKLV